MRVLHVIPAVAPSYGGPSQAVLEICRALIEKGIEAEIATTNADQHRTLDVSLENKILYQEVPTYFFQRSLNTEYKFSWPFTEWLKENIGSYNLVHIHSVFCYPTVIAARLAQRHHLPYLIRPAGILDDWPMARKRLRKRLYLNWIERKSLNGAASIHYTSEEEKVASEKFGFRAPSVVIPLGFDINSHSKRVARGSFRRKYPQCNGKSLIVFLSRLDPKKGLEILVPALSNLRRNRNDFIFVIAGQGESDYEAVLKRKIQKVGLGSETIFAGFLEGEEKQTLLQDADLFVLPSYQENFGWAIIEAMAEGVPVVISDQVDIGREIEAFGAGQVVPCDAQAVGHAIQDLLSDDELRRRMGKNGRRLVIEKFSSGKMAGSLIHLYEAILSKKLG